MDMTRKCMEGDQMEDNLIRGQGGRNLYIRYTNAIPNFDLNQLHVDGFLDTMDNDDYRLFQCSHKFSYLTVDYHRLTLAGRATRIFIPRRRDIQRASASSGGNTGPFNIK